MMKAHAKPMCKYGAKCYRQNKEHLNQYSHTKRKSDEVEVESDEEDSPRFSPKRQKQPNTHASLKPTPKQQNEAVPKPSPKQHDEVSPKVSPTQVTEGSSKASPMQGNEAIQASPKPSRKQQNEVSPTASPKKHTEDAANTSETEPKMSNDDSDDAEQLHVPTSPEDTRENVKQKYLVDMPEDFWEFFNLCKSLSPQAPKRAFESCLGFVLVGPYDIVLGKHKDVKRNRHGKVPNFLCHWRYYYDPPEFTTVIKGDNKTQFHLGYYRDVPADMPVFVAANNASDNGSIVQRGENLFAAVKFYLDERIKNKGLTSSEKAELQSRLSALTDKAHASGFSLEQKTKAMKDREKKVVCRTFHGAGIVVPVDDNDVGYRPVPESPGDLKRILKKIVDSKSDTERDKNLEPLQELMTLVQFANDECDYGEGLELGIDLFTYGGHALHNMITHLLPLAYQLLGRHEYATVIKAHLSNRTKEIAKINQLTKSIPH